MLVTDDDDDDVDTSWNDPCTTDDVPRTVGDDDDDDDNDNNVDNDDVDKDDNDDNVNIPTTGFTVGDAVGYSCRLHEVVVGRALVLMVLVIVGFQLIQVKGQA